MEQVKNLYRSVIFLLLMATLHFAALHYFLYWKFRWFDILPHFAGGLGIGFGLIWISSKIGKLKNKYANVFIFLLISLTIFLAWEYFEYAFGLSFVKRQGYLLDTVKDLAAGTTGTLIALFINYRINKN